MTTQNRKHRIARRHKIAPHGGAVVMPGITAFVTLSR